MKKIISVLLLVIFVSTNFSFAAGTTDCSNNSNTEGCPGGIMLQSECSNAGGVYEWSSDGRNCSCILFYGTPAQQEPVSCENIPTAEEIKNINNEQLIKKCTDNGGDYTLVNKECMCTIDGKQSTCSSIADKTTGATGTAGTTTNPVMGISCSPDQLVNGQCKLNIYDTLGIRKSVRNEGDATSVGLFVQDIVLSATFFIGTLVTVALIVSGLMYIFAASSGKDPADAKKGIIGSLIGLLVVVSSYVIIRLVQYIAKGF